MSPAPVDEAPQDSLPKYSMQAFSPKPEKQLKLGDLLKMGGLSFHENVGNLGEINFEKGIQ